MLTVSGLTVAFGPRTVLDGLSLSAEPGTMTALTGASGSGKSTLLNCLGTLLRPGSGSIRFTARGRDTEVTALRGRALHRFRATTLGFLFQSYALVPEETVRANLAVAMDAVPRRQRRAAAAAALEAVGLPDAQDVRVHTLSGGEQQRVALARVMVRRPALVLADEPTGALDLGNTEMVLDHLRSFAQDGATVVVATHDPRVVAACDQEVTVGSGG